MIHGYYHARRGYGGTRRLSATLWPCPVPGLPEENDKKRSQLTKAVTQPLAPGVCSNSLPDSSRCTCITLGGSPARNSANDIKGFLGRMIDVLLPGNINHDR